MASALLPDAARQNIRAIRDLEAEVARRRTRADWLTDAVSRFGGSFRFLFIKTAVFLGWVGGSTLRSRRPGGRSTRSRSSSSTS